MTTGFAKKWKGFVIVTHPSLERVFSRHCRTTKTLSSFRHKAARAALLHLKSDPPARWVGQRRRINDVHDALQDADDGGFVDIEAFLEFLFQRGQFTSQIALFVCKIVNNVLSNKRHETFLCRLLMDGMNDVIAQSLLIRKSHHERDIKTGINHRTGRWQNAADAHVNDAGNGSKCFCDFNQLRSRLLIVRMLQPANNDVSHGSSRQNGAGKRLAGNG